MIRILSRFASIICCVGAFAASSSAMAQIFGSATPTVAINFGEQNPQLKKILELQYQLQVLKRLIDHEKAVNGVVQSAISIGIKEPAIPTPNKELCAQVPANIPCAQAYGDMYKDFSVEVVKQIIPITPPSADIASSMPAIDAGILPSLPTDMAGADLFWTDITCFGGKCTAIVSPEPQNPMARYRISPGETLPDGAVIKQISYSGVSIMRGKKTIQLEPAPKA